MCYISLRVCNIIYYYYGTRIPIYSRLNGNYYHWLSETVREYVFFFLFISSSPPPCVCSHQFSGDFYKSFVAHIKRDSRVAVKDDKKYGPFVVRFFRLFFLHLAPTSQPSLCLFYHQHKYCEYVLRTSLRPPSFIQVSK